MWNKFSASPYVYPYLFLGVLLSTALGFWFSSKLLLPLLNIAVSYPVMYSLLGSSRRNPAFATMLFWALCTGVVTVFASIHFPSQASASILHGERYASEMFDWIRTGKGAEGDPVRFVPQHLLHLAIFVVLSILTASILSLLMGAVLMNYMSYYVGSLIRVSSDPSVAGWMGWHPWSILRVISFVILGVILAEPVICKIKKRDYDFGGVRPYLWGALAGLGLDILTKAALAPWWGLKLRSLIP